MKYKEETKLAYEKYADPFEKFAEQFKSQIEKEIVVFVKYLKGKKILDLGSGPGTHALLLKKRGFDVLCVDISKEMIKRCKQKGLKAKVVDIEKLELPAKRFDGIWAYASLLHVSKEKLPKIVNKIAKLLKPNGVLAVSFYGGSGEGYVVTPGFPGVKRWFSFFTDTEVQKLFENKFEIVY